MTYIYVCIYNHQPYSSNNVGLYLNKVKYVSLTLLQFENEVYQCVYSVFLTSISFTVDCTGMLYEMIHIFIFPLDHTQVLSGVH